MDTPRIPTKPGLWWARPANRPTDDAWTIVEVRQTSDGALEVLWIGCDLPQPLSAAEFMVPAPDMSDAITIDEEARDFCRDAQRIREMAERGELPIYI